MTTALLTHIAPILAPVRQLVHNLPTRRPSLNVTTGRVEDITSPATKASLAELEAKSAKRSKRTYYLGNTGRVSQRMHLVGGSILDRCRATTTEEARAIFAIAVAHPCGFLRSLLLDGAEVHIGESTAQKLHRIVSTLTGFISFDDLLNAKGSYEPTIDVSNKDLRFLADCYDRHQQARGDQRRAYRYNHQERKAQVVLDSRGRVIPKCWLNLSPDSVQTGRTEYQIAR